MKLPTHQEIKEAKAHLKQVDDAQEHILEAMFDDLRSNYDANLLERPDINLNESQDIN